MEAPDNRPNTPPPAGGLVSIWTTWSDWNLLGLFAALLTADFAIQILIYAQWGSYFVPALAGALFGVLMPLLALYLFRGLDVVADFRLGPPDPANLVLAGLLALTTLVPTSLLAELSLRLFPADPSWAARLQESVPTTDAGRAAALISAALVGPLAEEVLFRGLLLRLIERMRGPGTGLVLSAVIFGLIHLQPWLVFGLVGIGLVLGFVYLATRSLWACWVTHAVHNTIMLLILFSQDEVQTEPSTLTLEDWLWLGVSLLGFSLVVSLLWARRRRGTGV